jgi:peptidoglycan hydrolase CwlO-like protein
LDNLKLIQLDLEKLSVEIGRLQNEIEKLPDHIDSNKQEKEHLEAIGDIKRFEAYETEKQ